MKEKIKDKLIVLEDKYNNLPDGNYKKKQLETKIFLFKQKYASILLQK